MTKIWSVRQDAPASTPDLTRGEFPILSYKERQRIKAKDALRVSAPPPKKTIWNSITYSSVTSTIAILIAAISAYFANFYEHRALLLTIAPRPPSQMSTFTAKWHDSLTLSPIISNGGNHTEIIESVSIAVTYPGPAQSRGNPAGPFVLRGGDAITVPVTFSFARMASPLRIKFSRSLSPGLSGSGPGTRNSLLEGNVYVRVVALSPRNSLITVDIPISHIILPEDTSAYAHPDEDFEYKEQISTDCKDGPIDIFAANASQFPYSGPFSGETRGVLSIQLTPASRNLSRPV